MTHAVNRQPHSWRLTKLLSIATSSINLRFLLHGIIRAIIWYITAAYTLRVPTEHHETCVAYMIALAQCHGDLFLCFSWICHMKLQLSPVRAAVVGRFSGSVVLELIIDNNCLQSHSRHPMARILLLSRHPRGRFLLLSHHPRANTLLLRCLLQLICRLPTTLYHPRLYSLPPPRPAAVSPLSTHALLSSNRTVRWL